MKKKSFAVIVHVERIDERFESRDQFDIFLRLK